MKSGNAILLNPELPKTVTVGGREIPVNWGFRTGMRMDCMRFDKRKTDAENLADMVNAFYINPSQALSSGPQAAVDAMLVFFSRGSYKPPEKDAKSHEGSKGQTARAYDFAQDADIILGDFFSNYGMMLNRIDDEDLHWWEFMAMFSGLPEKSTIRTYMHYRTCNLSGLSKNEQKRIRKIRSRIRIREDYEDVELSQAKRLEKRNERWLAIAKGYS